MTGVAKAAPVFAIMTSKRKPLPKKPDSRASIQKLPTVTMHARYVFLDIVGFTHKRSVEAQAALVNAINQIVKNALAASGVRKLIVLPTGDGMCVAIESPEEMDIHIRVALKILSELESYNQNQVDVARQFKLRVGVNENDDNIVIDFNKRRNLAGAGINMAQRVMSAADENQIMVGQPVFEVLRHRESYMQAFRSYRSLAKHGIELPVHQLVLNSVGLNVDIPSQFKPTARTNKPLTTLIAYYIALTVKSGNFIVGLVNSTGSSYVAKTLFWFLAQDTMGFAEASESNPYDSPKTWNSQNATLAEQFDYYDKADFWLTCDLSKMIDENLDPFRKLFNTNAAYGFEYLFPNESAIAIIKSEFPEIWNELDLDS